MKNNTESYINHFTYTKPTCFCLAQCLEKLSLFAILAPQMPPPTKSRADPISFLASLVIYVSYLSVHYLKKRLCSCTNTKCAWFVFSDWNKRSLETVMSWFSFCNVLCIRFLLERVMLRSIFFFFFLTCYASVFFFFFFLNVLCFGLLLECQMLSLF